MLRFRLFASLALLCAVAALARGQENINPIVGRITSQDAVFSAIDMHPECKRVAAGFASGQIVFMNPMLGKVATMHSWLAHGKNVTVLRFSPDGKQFASGGIDGSIRFWDVDTCGKYQDDTEKHNFDKTVAAPDVPKATRILRSTHSGGVRGLAFSPDGKLLASCGADGNIKIWSMDEDKPMFTIAAHKNGANAVAFSPDGKTIASAGGDKFAKLWGIAADAEPKLKIEHESPVLALAFKADGKQLATGSGTPKKSGEARVFSVSTGKEEFKFTDHTEPVTAVGFHPKQARFVSASKDKTLRVWNLETMREGYREEHRDAFLGAGFSADGRLLGLVPKEGNWWRGVNPWPKSGK